MDCTQLTGRMREICEGRSGLSPELEQKYRDKWARRQHFRLGDLAEKLIRMVGLGRKKCEACLRRKQWLNRIL